MLGLGIKNIKRGGGGLYSNDDLNIHHLKHGGGGAGIESIDPPALHPQCMQNKQKAHIKKKTIY